MPRKKIIVGAATIAGVIWVLFYLRYGLFSVKEDYIFRYNRIKSIGMQVRDHVDSEGRMPVGVDAMNANQEFIFENRRVAVHREGSLAWLGVYLRFLPPLPRLKIALSACARILVYEDPSTVGADYVLVFFADGRTESIRSSELLREQNQ